MLCFSVWLLLGHLPHTLSEGSTLKHASFWSWTFHDFVPHSCVSFNVMFIVAAVQVEKRSGASSVSLNVWFWRQRKGSPLCPQFGYYPKYKKLEVILVQERKRMLMNFWGESTVRSTLFLFNISVSVHPSQMWIRLHISEMAGMLLMQCNLFASRMQGLQVHWQKRRV